MAWKTVDRFKIYILWYVSVGWYTDKMVYMLYKVTAGFAGANAERFTGML